MIDIDLKGHKDSVTREDILLTCVDYLGFMPFLILVTPNGYHVYFLLDKPLFITNKNDFKGLKVAKRIANNLTRALGDELEGVDLECNPFGFFRVPTNENIIHMSENTYSLAQFMSWSQAYEDDNKCTLSLVKSQNTGKQIDEEWFKVIINNRDITKGYELGRNNTVLTLSLACYQSNLSQSECYDMMDQFNTYLDTPLKDSEIRKTVKSAYSGKYQAAAPCYINKLMQIWGDGSEYKASYQRVFKHVKRERTERVRSHYDEWEQNVIDYIEAELDYSEPFIWRTQKELCEAIGIPSSTLNVLIKQSTKLIKVVSGKGRNAKTGWSTVAIFLKHLLFELQETKLAYKKYIQHVLNDVVAECIASSARTLLETKINQLADKLGITEDKTHTSALRNTS